MNRRLAFLITLLFIFIMSAPVPLYAAGDPLFSIGPVADAAIGDTVSVPVIVSNNPGFAAVGLALTYDPNALEITDVIPSVGEMPLNSQFALTLTPGTQWIPIINDNLADWAGDGTLVNVLFKILPTAPLGGSAIGLAFTNSPNGTPANANGNILADSETASGQVNIVDDDNNDNNDTIPNNTDSGSGGNNNIPNNTGANENTANRENNPAENTPPPLIDNVTEIVDFGEFIGNEDPVVDYEPENTPPPLEDNVPTVVVAATSEPLKTDNRANFGEVPQTGLRDISKPAAALGLASLGTAALWIYILRCKYRLKNNG